MGEGGVGWLGISGLLLVNVCTCGGGGRGGFGRGERDGGRWREMEM